MSLRTHLVRIAAVIAAMLAPLLLPGTASAQCARDCLVAGDYDFSGTFGGLQRTYKVHIPKSYDGKRAVPLVVDLHGFTGNAQAERNASGQLEQSDKRGFIVIWPDGLGLNEYTRGWNAYGCCATSHAYNIDDVGFLRSLIVLAKQHMYIDASRVYVTGLSNGGFMAHRMACEAADLVSAAVAVSAPLNRAGCTPAKPITIFSIAGTADSVIPYYGKPDFRYATPVDNGYSTFPGIPQQIQPAPYSGAAWKRNNRCTNQLITRTLMPKVQEDYYSSCANGVRVGLLTITDGEHVLYKRLNANVPLDVSEYIWSTVFK